MPRVYERKFDWNEAKRRYAAGESLYLIASELGVSHQAVRRVVVPGKMEEQAAYSRTLKGAGRCDDCGGPTHAGSRYRGSTRCRDCASLALATSVRENELMCFGCKEWKPDEEFPLNKADSKARRWRHSFCRGCQTIARREYRNRNKVPCADGCGTLVLAPNEQAASARSHGATATGCCRSCANRRVQARRRLVTQPQTGEN
jgi:hypothetical protein